MGPTDPVRARYFSADAGRYVCGLCPHGCRIAPGGYGRCGSRRGEADFLSACTYGAVSSMAIDPMEKKPLYHYRPGEGVFSVGSVGCNMTCMHCQNHSISQSPAARRHTVYESPQDLASMCRAEGMDCIAFTYTEPSIWFEYILDVMEADPDLGCVVVSNGLLNEEPLRELCGVTDAFNIDVKGFTPGFYRDVCGAELEHVLRSLRIIHEEGVHLELTYLVIPGYNDTGAELNGFCDWVLENLSPDVPVHLTRFHPDNRMTDVPCTPEDTMYRARSIAASKGLHYVYLGNMLSEYSDTVCPECGSTAVRRTGYTVDTGGLDGGRCRNCGHDLNIVR